MNFFFRYKTNNNKNNSLNNKYNSNAINPSNTSNFTNSTQKLKTLDFLNDSTNMELSDKLMHRTNSNNNNNSNKEKNKLTSQNDDDELGDNEPLKENNNNNNKAKNPIATLTDKNADANDKEKSNQNVQANNEQTVNNEINDKLESNEPVDDKTNLVASKIEKLNLDATARVRTSRRSSKNSNSVSRSFIRRLLSCGGSCTGNRRASNSLLFSNTNNNNNNNNASHGGLLTKSKLSDQTRKSSESSLSLNKLQFSAENSNLNETQQFKSDSNLNQKEEDQQETIENSYEYASYESIIDKFVNSKIYNENYKLSLSSNNIIESGSFSKASKDLINIKQKDEVSPHHHHHQSSDQSNKDSNGKSFKLVLPILKINDDYLNSPNVQTKKEFHQSNTDESVSEEFEEDDEEEIIEIDEDEEVDEYEEYDDECDEVHNVAFHCDANYHLNLDSDNNNEVYANVQSEYDDNELKKSKKTPNNNGSFSKQDKKTPSRALVSNAKQSELKNLKPLDDLKGGASNRTSSNLSSTTQSRKSNDLIDSSNECFEPFQKNYIKSSLSNFSIKNNFESELNDENMNSADNGANLLVHLISRKHKIQNSSTKNLTSDHLSSYSSIAPLSKSPSPIFLGNFQSKTNFIN